MLVKVIVTRILSSFLLNTKRKYRLAKLSLINNTCRFDNSCKLELCIFEKYVVVFSNTEIYSTKIGSYSYIQSGGRIYNCEIGRFCSIAAGVSIAPGIHDMNMISTHPIFVQKSTPLPKVYAKQDYIKHFKKVIIGHDVWIGEKVVILDGINIGNGAVIAAGAIVVKDVAPFSVVGGIPAKHIKYRFDNETIEFIEKSQWWNFTEGWFEENSEIMLDINKFKETLNAHKENY